MKHSTVDQQTGASHGSIKSYLVGFILSVILTVIPFYMVMTEAASSGVLVTTIAILAVVQIIVQIVYFLHMNTSSEQRWNLTALVFTLLIIIIVVGGSIWIMHELNINMMSF